MRADPTVSSWGSDTVRHVQHITKQVRDQAPESARAPDFALELGFVPNGARTVVPSLSAERAVSSRRPRPRSNGACGSLGEYQSLSAASALSISFCRTYTRYPKHPFPSVTAVLA